MLANIGESTALRSVKPMVLQGNVMRPTARRVKSTFCLARVDHWSKTTSLKSSP